MSEAVHILSRKLVATERDRYGIDTDAEFIEQPVERRNGLPPTVDVLDALMEEMRRRQVAGDWADRSVSDRWSSPRVHFALRLCRSEAAQRGLWHWLALRYPWYLEWRWSDSDGVVAEDRWWGQINKQAFARLWWGAEIFRDGRDYGPVEKAFVFQDLPNSLLHRPIVRCRSLALAIVDRLDQTPSASANHVNRLAKVLNLATVGSPPEVETNYQADDFVAFERWAESSPRLPKGWDEAPFGPESVDTSAASLAGGSTVVGRGWSYAKLD